jgi:hypothetical protein
MTTVAPGFGDPVELSDQRRLVLNVHANVNDDDRVELLVRMWQGERITDLEVESSTDTNSIAQHPGRLDERRRDVDCRDGTRESRSDLTRDTTDPATNVGNLGLSTQVERVQQVSVASYPPRWN